MTKTTSAKYSYELDEAIRDYCFKNNLTLKSFFERCGMSGNNFFMIRKRGIIGPKSLAKIRKYISDFDFNSLKKVDDNNNERN